MGFKDPKTPGNWVKSSMSTRNPSFMKRSMKKRALEERVRACGAQHGARDEFGWARIRLRQAPNIISMRKKKRFAQSESVFLVAESELCKSLREELHKEFSWETIWIFWLGKCFYVEYISG